MHARKLGRYILPFVITLLLIDPFAISMSLFYTSVYTVAMLTSIAFLLKRDWLCERKERLALLFVLAGCATSYLDLMTYPLLAYGIPATLCLCSAEGGWKQGLKLVAVTLAAWFVGYAGMWVGKWIIGALFGGEDMGVLETIQLRASTSAAPGVDISFVRIVLRQLVRLRSPALVAGLLYVAIAGVCFLQRSPRQKLAGLAWTPYIAVCLLPLLWEPPYKTILLSIPGLHTAYWPYALLRECVCSRGFPQRQTTPGHCARKAHCPHTAAFKPF